MATRSSAADAPDATGALAGLVAPATGATGTARVSSTNPSYANALRINDRLAIPRAELMVRATRASGAGGQHVNKTSTRVEVVWNAMASPSLAEADRARLAARLATRLTEQGELRVVAADTRSQLQNRELAESRLADMVRRALVVPKPRKKTRPSRAAREARLSDKRKASERKRERRNNTDD